MQTHMDDFLEIRGYRGFKQFRVEKVRPVNLLIGKNNSGKTSVLEAVDILNSELSRTRAVVDALRRRVELRPVEFEDEDGDLVTRIGGDLRMAVHNRAIPTTSGGLLFQVLRASRTVSATVGKSTELQPELNLGAEPQAIDLVFINTTSRDDTDQEVHRLEDGIIIAVPPRRVFGRKGQNRVLYVGATSLTEPELASIFNTVIENGQEEFVFTAMQAINSGIEGVYFLAGERVGQRSAVLVQERGVGRVPLGSFGDGVKRLFAVAVALVHCQGETLLLDEIDTGLHYAVMDKLWDVVLSFVSGNPTEVWATTHSLDCLKGLQEHLNAHPEHAELIAVHRIDNSLDRSVSFTGEALITALNSDVELR
jgi:energy-coupling factor transporter ATP-binding protein EcfA2